MFLHWHDAPDRLDDVGMTGANQGLLQVLDVDHVGAALLGLQGLRHVLYAHHEQHARGEVIISVEP